VVPLLTVPVRVKLTVVLALSVHDEPTTMVVIEPLVDVLTAVAPLQAVGDVGQYSVGVPVNWAVGKVMVSFVRVELTVVLGFLTVNLNDSGFPGKKPKLELVPLLFSTSVTDRSAVAAVEFERVVGSVTVVLPVYETAVLPLLLTDAVVPAGIDSEAVLVIFAVVPAITVPLIVIVILLGVALL